MQKSTFTPRTPTNAVQPPRASRCILHPSETALPNVRLSARLDQEFAFRATDYYTGLIDPADPADPIRKLIMPSDDELIEFGTLDASNEAANTVVPGLQHKYHDTALMLVTDQCAGFCRYCFRKRLFSDRGRETLHDWRPAVDYIAGHPEITDVLMTGGDPLTLPTKTLRAIVEGIMSVPHVQTIRIGSKVPAFNPSRVYADEGLHALIGEVVSSGRSLYVMTHFDHPHELTPRAVAAVSALRDAGATCLNQCPVTAGINDDASVLAELLELTTAAGCPQYYLFQCRPTRGNAHFVVPIERAFQVVDEARSRVSGLSRRARFCMSHEDGKVEVVGMDDERFYARFHRAKSSQDASRMMVFARDPGALWLEDLREWDWQVA
ncbi:MAG: KamA family radical SAM protein [Actinobacteria bacterium HGW-Actinobacteria-10]|nr:MAG: KamA family radical SAM protein [Actinobacteria bacterium HGW-Actinobacteria-10]